MGRKENNTEILLKIGFYFVWGVILFLGWSVPTVRILHGYDEETFLTVKRFFEIGFIIAFSIQFIFGVLKWLIFDRHLVKRGEKNEPE